MRQSRTSEGEGWPPATEKLKRYYANGGTELTSGRRYLYDGWNVIAEYEDTGATALGSLKRTYTWGLDIARSLSDAGGVGALLQIADHSTGKTYLPAYDGNGNVAALFDASDGTVAAAYEYSPYGEFFRCEGTYAKTNPFRFSTKFTDDETGLVYYGRRYYAPSQGRFLGRDPIEESGGLNLYGFCRNNSINLWDYLGLNPPNPGPVVTLPAVTVSASRVYDDDLVINADGDASRDFGAGGGGGGFAPFTARTPLPLGLLNTITASNGLELVIVSSGGTDANGNPVWNAVPYNDFMRAQAAANLAAATAAVNASMADLRISAGQIAANFAAGIAAGVAGAALVVVTGPVGGAILLGAALSSTVPTYASMNGNPGAFTQQQVLDFTAGNVGAVIGGVGVSQLPGFTAPVSNLNLNLPTTGFRLANGEARLVITRDGQIVASTMMDAILTHRDFATTWDALNSDGSLKSGYWIGTAVREGNTTLAFNSMTFYNNQAVNADATILIGGGVSPGPNP